MSSAVAVRQEAKPFSTSLSLSLRVALLESLVAGRSELLGSGASISSSDVTRAPKTSEQSILNRTIQAQERLDEALKPHRPIGQFAADYAHHRPYLVPSFGNVKSLQSPPEDNPDAAGSDGQGSEGRTTLTPQAQMTLLLEAEQDLRDLERDLRQCQTYEERGVAGAGTLAGENILELSLSFLNILSTSLLVFFQRTRSARVQNRRCEGDSLEEVIQGQSYRRAGYDPGRRIQPICK